MRVLLTRRDLVDRKGYLNARNTLGRLLSLGAVPVVNENDTVSVAEFAFDVRRLVGRSGYRLRVGKWRVLLDIYEESRTIHVTRIGSRGDVYK